MKQYPSVGENTRKNVGTIFAEALEEGHELRTSADKAVSPSAFSLYRRRVTALMARKLAEQKQLFDSQEGGSRLSTPPAPITLPKRISLRPKAKAKSKAANLKIETSPSSTRVYFTGAIKQKHKKAMSWLHVLERRLSSCLMKRHWR